MQGGEVPVDSEGFVDPEILKFYVGRGVAMMSIQLVNHKIGTVQKLRELVDVARAANPMWLSARMPRMPTGGSHRCREARRRYAHYKQHKILGTRGVGVLYIREGLELEPVIRGQLSTEKLWPV